MSRQEQADLTLRLYEIRGKDAMREARHWFTAKFNPQSAAEIAALMASSYEESAPYRMVTTYWDMACAFVVFEAIDEKLFHATQTEHLVVFAKLEPFIKELREIFGLPEYLDNLEKTARRSPNATEYFVKVRGLMSRWNEAENKSKTIAETF